MSEQMESLVQEQSESRNGKRRAICDGCVCLTAATEAEALRLADLGHHAPQANVAQSVAKLHRAGKLGGFHIDDGRDGDRNAGAINPHSLFMISTSRSRRKTAKLAAGTNGRCGAESGSRQ
jgi:hypothetical protein